MSQIQKRATGSHREKKKEEEEKAALYLSLGSTGITHPSNN